MKMPDDMIREEIRKSGILPFERFMELALYCPEYGYYERQQDNVGRRGDFYTSVSVGPLFGELLAFQFAEWLEEIQTLNPQHQDSTLNLIEAGAHDGKLASDILNWLRQHRPELFGKIECVILEPSPRRREWQKKTLEAFQNVRWLDRFNASSLQPFNGIIFSNELLDAFPVRRFGWDAVNKEWFEWGVTAEGEKFSWARITHHGSRERLPSSIYTLPSSLLEVLPEGYTIEISPAAEKWWGDAANSLSCGKLVAIDYGFTSDEQFSPARTRGTLRAYARHQISDDLLANPGEQDLTAHVNFTAIQTAGESVGLNTETYCPQSQFLTRILSATMKKNAFRDWSGVRTRQFQTLTHPEHLGRSFKVLVQSK